MAILCLVCGLGFSSIVNAQNSPYLKYQIQENDSLGDILLNLGIIPIWSNQGSYKQTLSLNSSLMKSNGEKLPPNLWIDLPVKSLPPSDRYEVKNGIVRLTGAHEKKVKVVSRPKKMNKKAELVKVRKSKTGDINIIFEKGAIPESFYKSQTPIFNIYINEKNEATIRQPAAVSPKESQMKSDISGVSFWSSFHWHLQSQYSFYALQGQDVLNNANAKIVADSMYGLNAKLGYALSDSWSVLSQLSFSQTDLNGTNTVSVNQESLSQFGFHLGAGYEISSRLESHATLFYMNRNFLQDVVGSSLQVDNLFIPGAQLGVKYNFFETSSLGFSFFSDALYFLSQTKNNVAARSGYGFIAGLESQIKLGGSQRLGLALSYQQNFQDSERVTQEESIYIFSLTYYPSWLGGGL